MIILEFLYDFFIAFWNDYLEKIGQKYNTKKKSTKVLAIIILNIVGIIGLMLLIAIYFIIFFLIEQFGGSLEM